MQSEEWYQDRLNRATLRRRLFNTASAEIGYVEKFNNDTKYGKWFGMNHVAWCAMFVSWVYAQSCAGLDVPNPLEGWQTRRGFAGVTGTWAVIAKRYPHYIVARGDSPMIGDICFWDHNSLAGGPGHTELVIAATGKVGGKLGLVTIGGNTKATDRSSRNGGEVATHNHDVTVGKMGDHGYLLGIVRPTRRFYKAGM